MLLAQSSVPAASAATSPGQMFKKARAAAAKLPSLLAARELGLIARDEMVAIPQQGLTDYEALYEEVSAWQTGGDSPVQRSQQSLQWLEQQNAIEAFAGRGKFKRAMAWLAGFDPGESAGQTAGMVCSYVIDQMLAHREFGQVEDVLGQCSGQGHFPFGGAATALDARPLPELERMNIAESGLSNAGSAPYVPSAATFLAAVHNAFPEMDGQIEDAIIALLQHAKSDAATNKDHATPDTRGGSMLLAILGGFDPERAQTAKAQFPDAASASFGGGLVYQASPTGKVTGATIGLTPDQRLYQMAAAHPGRALDAAGGLKDSAERFAALAGIAEQADQSRPILAAHAADQAYELLNSDIAAAETGYTANLANAYFILGDSSRASEVAGKALDAADQHAAQAEGQFDLSTSDEVARLSDNLILPATLLTYPYANLALRFPSLVLQHAMNCACAVLRPLILSKIAEGMTTEGAKLSR